MKNTLSTAEAAPFRERLVALRRHLGEENVQEEFIGLSEAARVTADPVDATSMSEFADVLGTLSLGKDETLAQINAAIERIDGGTYGACEECDGKISKARLEALPQTPHCIDCQRRIEEGTNGTRQKVRRVLRQADND